MTTLRLKKDKDTPKDAYRALAEKGGAATDCITCRMCEESCPQKLPITEHLKAVAKAFA